MTIAEEFAAVLEGMERKKRHRRNQAARERRRLKAAGYEYCRDCQRWADDSGCWFTRAEAVEILDKEQGDK